MPEELIKAKIVVDDAEAKKQLDEFQKAADKQAKEQEKATKAQAKAEEKAAKEAERVRKKTAQDYEKLGKTLAAFGAAAVYGIGIAVKATMDYNVELETLHKKTGIAVEDIAGLGYAAQMEEASLESLATGLKFLARNADEAARGNKAAADAFARAGIQVTDSEGRIRPVKDLMLDLAGAMAAMPNEAQKTGLAMDLLGRSGQDLVPMLSLGKTEIAALAREAEKLGIVTDTQTAEAWDKLDDTLVRTRASIQGAKQSISNNLLPAVQGLAEFVAGAASGFTQLPDGMQAYIAASTATVGVTSLLAGSVLGLVGWLRNLQNTLQLSSMTLFGWIGAAIALVGVIAGVGAAIAKTNAETKSHNTELQKLLKTDGDVVDSLEKHNKLTNDQADAIARIGELFPQFVTKWDEHGRAIELDTERLKDYNAELETAAKREADLRAASMQRELVQLRFEVENYNEAAAIADLMSPGTDDTPGRGMGQDFAAASARDAIARKAARIRELEGLLGGTEETGPKKPPPTDPPPSGNKELTAVERLGLALDVLRARYEVTLRERGLATDSSAALALKESYLNDAFTIQAQKVSLLQQQYDKLAKTKGAASDAAQQLMKQLLDEKQALLDIRDELDKAYTDRYANLQPDAGMNETYQSIISALYEQAGGDRAAQAWAEGMGLSGDAAYEAYTQRLMDEWMKNGYRMNDGVADLNLPKYHSGGRNTTGAEQLAIIKNDETVLPSGVAPVQIAVQVSGNTFGAGADPYGFGGQLARGMIDEMRIRGVRIGGR
jgi:hypothetical protein